MKNSASKTQDLESAEALAFQRKSWKIQRVGWFLMGALLVLALLGAFGDGWLARTSRHSADSTVSVRYDRVARLESPAEIEISAVPEGDGTLDLTVDQALLAATSLSDLQPLPREIVALPGGQRLSYRAEGATPVALRFRITPHRLGRLRARFTGPRSQSLDISFLVLP
jgi:hypothetical protein